MENASKALLIAAAVLIVVLLIAFGMRIFNQSSTSSDVSGTAEQIQSGLSGAQEEITEILSPKSDETPGT